MKMIQKFSHGRVSVRTLLTLFASVVFISMSLFPSQAWSQVTLSVTPSQQDVDPFTDSVTLGIALENTADLVRGFSVEVIALKVQRSVLGDVLA